MAMLNLNITLAGAPVVTSQVLESRAKYAQALNIVFANIHHYPNGQLLGHSAGWFNLSNAPGSSIQPSESVKWQLLFVAQSYLNMDGSVHTHPEFNLDALSPDDVVLLYRMIISFLQAESNAKRFISNASTISRHYLSLLGDHILNMCETNKENAQQLKRSIIAQEDLLNLEGLMSRVTKLIALFDKLQVEDKRSAILSYLKDFSATIKTRSEWEFELEYYIFLKVVDRVCPELQVFDHFFDFGMGLLISVAIDQKGFQILLDHFNTKVKDGYKYNGKLGDVTLTNVMGLTGHLKEMEDTKFYGIRKFHVLNGGKEMGGVGGHYDPIFVRRNQFGTTLIIADSGQFHTKEKQNIWLPVLKIKIDEANIKNLTIYTFRSGRQSDSLSCGITSFRDVLESAKVDLFAYIEGLSPSQVKEEQGMLVIDHYPPEFMKVRQSTSYIEKYEKDMPESKTAIVASKSIATPSGIPEREDKTLRKVVVAHTITRGDAKVNFYLREKAYKYFGLIVRALVDSKLPA